MLEIQGGPGRGRYMVSSSNSKQLTDFITQSGNDQELKLVETIGPQSAPHTAVYDMPHETAAALARRFETAGDLKIEPDRPLSMFNIL